MGLGGIYERISKPIGLQNYQYNIFHDDGNKESDGGGKTCAYISPPGKGKSTLMAQSAQYVHCVGEGSKKSFLSRFNAGKNIEGYDVRPETVIWRLREFDNINALFPENWKISYPTWSWSFKPVHIFVHERDSPVFFCIVKGKAVPPINMPPIERYRDAEDVMEKLHWNCINAVLEPQSYRLSNNLSLLLKQHKMEDEYFDEDEPEQPKRPAGVPATQGRVHPIDPKTGEPIRWKYVKKPKPPKPKLPDKRKKKEVDYSRKYVDPAYFWYDLLDFAYRLNNRKHITVFIDEFHDVAEADCEGDAWKLVSILSTKKHPQFRKNNLSLHISTHHLSMIDYRMVRRVEYINWFRGAKISPNVSMINLQPLLSGLEMGVIINEELNIQFGIMEFEKIFRAPPQLYIEGLKGQNPSITEKEFEHLLQVQEGLVAPDYFKEKNGAVLPDVIEV